MEATKIETGSRVRYVGNTVLTCEKGAEGTMLGSFDSKRGPAYRVEFPTGVETLFAAEFEVVATAFYLERGGESARQMQADVDAAMADDPTGAAVSDLVFGAMVRIIPGPSAAARGTEAGVVIETSLEDRPGKRPMVNVAWERGGTSYCYPHELEVIARA